MDRLPLVTVIIPVSPTEESWRNLLPDLSPIADLIEIIIAAPRSSKVFSECRDVVTGANLQLRVVETELGRARQMNVAARQARAEFLWFLHADSRLTLHALQEIIKLARENSPNLHYLDLVYQSDGPRLTRLNAALAFIRSRCFGLPFGDQGFFLNRNTFDVLGGFPEDCEYGEDHLLVWRAKRAGVKIIPVGAQILTSARRYQKHGWLQTTLRHARLFTTQVVQELFPSLKAKGDRCEHVL